MHAVLSSGSLTDRTRVAGGSGMPITPRERLARVLDGSQAPGAFSPVPSCWNRRRIRPRGVTRASSRRTCSLLPRRPPAGWTDPRGYAGRVEVVCQLLESVGGGLYPAYPHDGDQVPFDLVQHPVGADAQPAVATPDERARRRRIAGSSAKASTARLTAIIPALSAMKRRKVACAISDQMILTGSRRTPQP